MSNQPVPPDWLKPGCRVRKVGTWPRVRLPDGAMGTVVSLDIYDGRLRWFTVLWDNHAGYPRGIDHYGWHADGHVVPESTPLARGTS